MKAALLAALLAASFPASEADDAWLDLRQMELVDAYLRAKAQFTAEEWEALPTVSVEEDGALQELLGFLQTYDATTGDVLPLLQQLRAERLAR